MFETLTAIDPDAEEAALIERIAELERLKSAAAACAEGSCCTLSTSTTH
ncbi:HNH endonuclease, partial [Mycobacterium tuberculosis]|nr:HNH endonuclease [Mycobacterium tuberculosis]